MVNYFKTFMWLRFLLGHYFEVSSNKLTLFFAKLYCLPYLYIITLSHIILTDTFSQYQFIAIHFFVSDLTVTGLCLLTKQTFFFQYITTEQVLRASIGKKGKDIFFGVLSYMLAILVLRIFIYSVMVAIDVNEFDVLPVLVHLAFIKNDFANSVKNIIFCMFWRSLRKLRKYLDAQLNNTGIQEHKKIKIIMTGLFYYKNVLDNMGKTMKYISFPILLVLLNDFICFMVTFVHIIFNNSDNSGPQTITKTLQFMSLNMSLLHFFIMIYFAETAANEVDDIKAILAKEMLRYKDKAVRNAIIELCDYIEVRRPEFTVYRLFTINIDLLFGYISACVTTVIIILQIYNYMV